MHTTHHAETKIEHSPLQAQGEHDSEPKGRPHSQLLTEKYVCTVEVATAHCEANPPPRPPGLWCWSSGQGPLGGGQGQLGWGHWPCEPVQHPVAIDRFDCRPVVRTLGHSPRVLWPKQTQLKRTSTHYGVCGCGCLWVYQCVHVYICIIREGECESCCRFFARSTCVSAWENAQILMCFVASAFV